MSYQDSEEVEVHIVHVIIYHPFKTIWTIIWPFLHLLILFFIGRLLIDLGPGPAFEKARFIEQFSLFVRVGGSLYIFAFSGIKLHLLREKHYEEMQRKILESRVKKGRFLLAGVVSMLSAASIGAAGNWFGLTLDLQLLGPAIMIIMVLAGLFLFVADVVRKWRKK